MMIWKSTTWRSHQQLQCGLWTQLMSILSELWQEPWVAPSRVIVNRIWGTPAGKKKYNKLQQNHLRLRLLWAKRNLLRNQVPRNLKKSSTRFQCSLIGRSPRKVLRFQLEFACGSLILMVPKRLRAWLSPSRWFLGETLKEHMSLKGEDWECMQSMLVWCIHRKASMCIPSLARVWCRLLFIIGRCLSSCEVRLQNCQLTARNIATGFWIKWKSIPPVLHSFNQVMGAEN
mmetsp:Transcript_39296/g.77802  ORF Transcript_39296/g.77802 Transcript_39296/m.77802 type:complete len:230 (+) Transcript_39296:408-1097(+)